MLEHLEWEAEQRGLNYLYNTVREAQPDRERVAEWLRRRWFADHGGGELRKRVARGAPPRSE